MKQSAVVLLAAYAVLFSAAPVCALTPGTCADWEGNWVFTYDNGSRNDTIAITDICSKPTPSSPTPACMPEESIQDDWVCVARGKRVSDNKTVQIRQIAMDTANFGYYEATDEEIPAGGQGAHYASIAADTFTKCAFTSNGADFGLASGGKNNCTDATTTTTTAIVNTTREGLIYTENSTVTITGYILAQLRAFRYNTLAKSTIGRKAIQTCYKNGSSINTALERNPALRAATRRVLEVIAPWWKRIKTETELS